MKGRCLKALLVDDEAPARGELRFLLGSHPEVEVVGEAATAKEALELAASIRYDVVFLDVELPGMTGLEAASLVLDRRERPAIVFVTAHERYAADAFAVEAFDLTREPAAVRERYGMNVHGQSVLQARRLVEAMKPIWLRIGGYWYPRGGIPIDVLYQTGEPPAGLWLPDPGVPGYRGRG